MVGANDPKRFSKAKIAFRGLYAYSIAYDKHFIVNFNCAMRRSEGMFCSRL